MNDDIKDMMQFYLKFTHKVDKLYMLSSIKRGLSNVGGDEFALRLQASRNALIALQSLTNHESLRKDVGTLEARFLKEGADIWSDSNASQLARELHSKKSQLEEQMAFDRALLEAAELHTLADSENDELLKKECISIVTDVQSAVHRARLKSALTGAYDTCDCFVSVLAGAGGDDARNWAAMLAQMYTLWYSGDRGGTVRIVDNVRAQDDGTNKSSGNTSAGSQRVVADIGDSVSAITLKLSGADFSYGYMRAEAGVHRLVRLSPFNQSKRQTSFAQVLVYPDVPDTATATPENALLDSDIKIDTYKSSGAGGQHVNTTESAVRLTHLPTGIIVACQNERSQHQNKAIAMRLLRAKVLLQRQQERDQMVSDRAVGKGSLAGRTENSFGGALQVRSYVLHPYQLIKNARDDFETSDVDGFLRGEEILTNAMEQALAAPIK